MKNNENYNICSKCGGCCCQNLPGAFLPKQLSVQQIVDGVKKKQIQLWSTWGTIVPRPRNTSIVNHKITPIGYAHGNCMYLSPVLGKGCKLKFDDRPHECQGLIPHPSNCGTQRGASIDSISAAWRRSNKMTKALKILGIEGV